MWPIVSVIEILSSHSNRKIFFAEFKFLFQWSKSWAATPTFPLLFQDGNVSFSDRNPEQPLQQKVLEYKKRVNVSVIEILSSHSNLMWRLLELYSCRFSDRNPEQPLQLLTEIEKSSLQSFSDRNPEQPLQQKSIHWPRKLMKVSVIEILSSHSNRLTTQNGNFLMFQWSKSWAATPT